MRERLINFATVSTVVLIAIIVIVVIFIPAFKLHDNGYENTSIVWLMFCLILIISTILTLLD